MNPSKYSSLRDQYAGFTDLMWVGAWTGEDIMHRPNPEDLPKAIERVNKSIANMYATKETHEKLKLTVAHDEALTARHPAIHPMVAIARMGPNCCCEFASRAKTMVDAILQVGDEQRACN